MLHNLQFKCEILIFTFELLQAPSLTAVLSVILSPSDLVGTKYVYVGGHCIKFICCC